MTDKQWQKLEHSTASNHWCSSLTVKVEDSSWLLQFCKKAFCIRPMEYLPMIHVCICICRWVSWEINHCTLTFGSIFRPFQQDSSYDGLALCQTECKGRTKPINYLIVCKSWQRCQFPYPTVMVNVIKHVKGKSISFVWFTQRAHEFVFLLMMSLVLSYNYFSLCRIQKKTILLMS